ncbi:MAG: DUF4041 domain-containing protein [Pseudomonadota bacterium]
MDTGALFGLIGFIAFIAISTLGIQKLFHLIRFKRTGKKILPKLEAQLNALNEQIDKAKANKTTLQEKNKELTIICSNLESDKERLDRETKELQELQNNEQSLRNSINTKNAELTNILDKIESVVPQQVIADNTIQEICSRVDLYSRMDEFVSYGIYETPEYLYETSERFALEIKAIREKQKNMIKEQTVIICTSNSKHRGYIPLIQKALEEQKKLMIRTFNIECDLLISKVNPANYARTLERIEAIANGIEKHCANLMYGFSIEYIKLKYEECSLQYQHTLKKKEEQDEQKALREQMREEERARREYEAAIKKSEQEEDMYAKMLDKAKEALAKASDEERMAAEMRIAQLESELLEAKQKSERAKSMAEQTKKGHVYIISNIGSFGEDVFKIGLTRRLEPMDRVKELGDASVPFSFDVHALIAADDAPKMEAELHRAFTAKRVNAVNMRKEFFNVSLDEIRQKVQEIAGHEVSFVTTILAEEYFQSKRLRGL